MQTTVSRPVMNYISTILSQFNNDQAMEIGTYAIDKIANRLLIFEEEVLFSHLLYKYLFIGFKFEKVSI